MPWPRADDDRVGIDGAHGLERGRILQNLGFGAGQLADVLDEVVRKGES